MEVVVENAAIGRLEWNEESQWWSVAIRLPSGRSPKCFIEPTTPEHIAIPDSVGVFESAYPIIAWLREAENEIYDIATQSMLELYNSVWNEGAAISNEEFARRIELIDVWIPSDGSNFTMYFTDGSMEMFGGHDIVVRFLPNRQIKRAYLSG